VDAPQKHDHHPSPEHMNVEMDWFQRPALPIPMCARTRTERTLIAMKAVDVFAQEERTE
jgi:hypothetical protein